MTVSLGSIILPDHLTLDINGAGLGYSQRRLIGGASVVQADGNSGGRTLVLSGENHWTLEQVERIRDLQATGLAVELIHHRGTFPVLIVDTTDLQPTDLRANPPDDEEYSGTITMIEV
ncbi:MAG: hypothetical protein AB7U29_03455 [Desulfobulbus sp.]